MKKVKKATNSWDITLQKNTLHLLLWTMAWVLSIFALGAGPQLLWDFNTLFTVVAGVINFAIGIGMIVAGIRYVKAQDEMQRKMFLESAALTLGIAAVFAGNYQLWADVKLVSYEPQVWVVLSLIGLIHTACTAFVYLKYR